ncbi:MAG: hypothetical protein KGJ12_06395, partial [Gammaproteobacteria bacterium]|nr:hypothetical protein [Gammaproteobacteria bacterium]
MNTVILKWLTVAVSLGILLHRGGTGVAVAGEGAATGSRAARRTSRTEHAPPPPMPSIPYNAQTYDLTYRSFLAAGNVNAACGVALAAVKQRPHDAQWRRRLAKTAQWSHRPHLALIQLFYLATHGYRENLDPAIRLASGLHDHARLLPLLELKLQEQPDSRALWAQVIGIYQELGDPHRAIALLRKSMA